MCLHCAELHGWTALREISGIRTAMFCAHLADSKFPVGVAGLLRTGNVLALWQDQAREALVRVSLGVHMCKAHRSRNSFGIWLIGRRC